MVSLVRTLVWRFKYFLALLPALRAVGLAPGLLALGVLIAILTGGWTTPATWNPGQVVSANDLNTHLRDNLNYLLSGRIQTKSTYVAGANKTTTSATFGDVDAANVIVTLTPNSTRVLVCFEFFSDSPSANAAEYDILSVGLGARYGDATHGMAAVPLNRWGQVTLIALFTGLTAGVAQSFKLQFRNTVAASTTTILATTNPILMWAIEV